jgi:hypothetical protein
MRNYHPKWLPKNAAVYKPTYYNDIIRRWDHIYVKKGKYHT